MLIRSERNRCAFIKSSPLSATFCCIRVSFPISITGRTLMIPDASAKLLTFFCCLVFYFSPTAAKAEETEEVTTVSGKVDADKGEKKSKEGKKEGKGAKEGKGDEKEAGTKKKGEKGDKETSKKEGGEGKGKKSGEKGDKGEKGEKGGKGGAKGGAKKAQKWTLQKVISYFSLWAFCTLFFLKICIILYLKMNKNLIYKKAHCVCASVMKVTRISEYSKIIHLLLLIHNSLVNIGDQNKKKKNILYFYPKFTLISTACPRHSTAMRRWDETLAKHCPQTVSKARMSTPLSTFRHEINKKTMKQNTFFTPMRGILKTMKYNISSKIIGLTVHLISKKHNHCTCYNRNKILYYSILKCSDIIFHVFLFLFLLSFRFSCSGTSRLFNEGCLDYTTVTYVYLPSGKSWRARLNMKSKSTPFKNIVRTTTALINGVQIYN